METVRVPGMAMAGLVYEDSEIIIKGFRTQWALKGVYELVEKHADGGATIRRIGAIMEDRSYEGPDTATAALPDFHGVQSRYDWELERVDKLVAAIGEHMAADQSIGWTRACDWADELSERVRWLARMERNTGNVNNGPQAL